MIRVRETDEVNRYHQDTERLSLDFEGVPERITLRVVRPRRFRIRGGLPFNELERLGAMRLWEPLAGIPRHPDLPDDFDPALPDRDSFGG